MGSLLTRVAAISVAISAIIGCRDQSNAKSGSPEVVVYTALDRGFSEPILAEFTRRTGIRVLPQFDTESTKSLGLTNRIRAEQNRPRCDVFWNNEILNTLQLQREGLLSPISPAAAAGYPAEWKDPDGHWFGFAARARILLVNTKLVPDEACPASIFDLADPRWAGRTAIAKPLFGTTATHIACLFSSLGDTRALEYLDALKRNQIQIHDGNKGVAIAVGDGLAAFGVTDTDDALEELAGGKPVRVVYPDGGADGIGTLFLPNTLSVIKGAPHPQEALQLVNYLLSAEVEQALADGPSAQIPLQEGVRASERVKDPTQVKAMNVSWPETCAAAGAAREAIEKRFLTP